MLLPILLILVLPGCGREAALPESAELIQVSLERGHGSTWGNQFRITLTPEEILEVSQFPDRATDYQTDYNIPIPPETWQEIEEITLELAPGLTEAKEPGFLEKLVDKIKPPEVDGGEYRILKLTWESEGKSEEITYIWTGSPRELTLEEHLEDLAKTLIK